jgi:hypothetical protein
MVKKNIKIWTPVAAIVCVAATGVRIICYYSKITAILECSR